MNVGIRGVEMLLSAECCSIVGGVSGPLVAGDSRLLKGFRNCDWVGGAWDCKSGGADACGLGVVDSEVLVAAND